MVILYSAADGHATSPFLYELICLLFAQVHCKLLSLGLLGLNGDVLHYKDNIRLRNMTYLGRKNDVEATFQMAKLPAKTLIVVIVAMVG